MKILVGNDIDESLWHRGETRAWSQRALWFAAEHDLVILPCDVDELFVTHVDAVTGRRSSPRILRAPAGRYGDRVLDPRALMQPAFVQAVRNLTADKQIQYVPLYPSAQLLPFYKAVSGEQAHRGSDFLKLGGANLANSKAYFHLLARTVAAPAPRAVVAYSKDEAIACTRDLLDTVGAVVVKRAHAGAGAGNELLSFGAEDTSHLGVPARRTIEGPTNVQPYFDERWEWASNTGRYPVVIEEFVQASGSGYVEFGIEEAGPSMAGYGTLKYRRSRISQETVGRLPDGIADAASLFVDSGRLAEALFRFGYRGSACFDFLVTNEGGYAFTECNARTTTGSHLYGLARGTNKDSLIQHSADSDWRWISTADILSTIQDLDLLYDRATGRGVLLTIPAAPDPRFSGFLYASVGVPTDSLGALYDRLARLAAA